MSREYWFLFTRGVLSSFPGKQEDRYRAELPQDNSVTIWKNRSTCFNCVDVIYHLHFQQYEANLVLPAWVKSGHVGRVVGTWANPIAPAQFEGNQTSEKNLLWCPVTTSDTTGVTLSLASSCSQDFVLIGWVKGAGLGEAVPGGVTSQWTLPVLGQWETNGISTRYAGSSKLPQGLSHSKANRRMMGGNLFFSTPFCPQLSLLHPQKKPLWMLWNTWIGRGQAAQKERVDFSCRPVKKRLGSCSFLWNHWLWAKQN